MGDELGKVSVDTGMVLLVDPGYLFTGEEWRAISRASIAAGPDDYTAWYREILAKLAEKTGRPMERLAVVAGTRVGDGVYPVRMADQGLLVEM